MYEHRAQDLRKVVLILIHLYIQYLGLEFCHKLGLEALGTQTRSYTPLNMTKASCILIVVAMVCLFEKSYGYGTYYLQSIPALPAAQFSLPQLPPLSTILAADCDKKEESESSSSSSSSSSSESKEEKGKKESGESGEASGEEKEESEEGSKESKEEKEEKESKESKESGESKEKKEEKEKKKKPKKLKYEFPPVSYTVPRPLSNIVYASAPYPYQPQQYSSYSIIQQPSYAMKPSYQYVYQPSSRIVASSPLMKAYSSPSAYSTSYGTRFMAAPSYFGGNLGYYRA